MCHGFVPKNTAADTEKCMQLFQSWEQAKNLRFPSYKVPADILLTDDHTLLAKWLCRFSVEAHKIDGELYLPKTLQHYLMGIRRHIQKQKVNQINLMLILTFKTFLITIVYCC